MKAYNLNINLATLANGAELIAGQDKILNIQAFESNYFCGKSYFEYDFKLNFLASCKRIVNINHISAWKFKQLTDESTKLSAAFNNSLALALNYNNTKLQARLDGSCLNQDKVTFTHDKVRSW